MAALKNLIIVTTLLVAGTSLATAQNAPAGQPPAPAAGNPTAPAPSAKSTTKSKHKQAKPAKPAKPPADTSPKQ